MVNRMKSKMFYFLIGIIVITSIANLYSYQFSVYLFGFIKESLLIFSLIYIGFGSFSVFMFLGFIEGSRAFWKHDRYAREKTWHWTRGAEESYQYAELNRAIPFAMFSLFAIPCILCVMTILSHWFGIVLFLLDTLLIGLAVLYIYKYSLKLNRYMNNKRRRYKKGFNRWLKK